MTTTDLEARYGRRRHLSDTQKYALTVVALLVGSVLAYIVFRNSQPAVQGTITGYTPQGAGSVAVQLEVDKGASHTASCLVQALDAKSAVVGQVTAKAPAGRRTVHLQVTVPTTSTAVAVQVQSCEQS